MNVFAYLSMNSLIAKYLSAASTSEAAERIGGYLDALSTGSDRHGGAGIASYLSSMTTSTSIDGASAGAVKSYLDGVSSGTGEAASAPVVKELLDSVSSGASTGTGIGNYLSALPVTNARLGGGGIHSYLASVPSNSARLGGAGFAGYLDGIGQACDAVQPDNTACAEAVSDYTSALSSGDAS